MAAVPEFTDQHGHRIRFEWGPVGARALVDQVRACVIVDVLSFSTAVSVAADAGIVVHPWPWLPEPGTPDAETAARALDATLAVHRDRARSDPAAVSLSPASLRRTADRVNRVLLPSPNGASISAALADRGVEVLAGCLRNRTAVAHRLAAVLDAGAPQDCIAVIAAGERWPDDTLRPTAEDLLGAGAILAALIDAGHDDLSVEARLAAASWRLASGGRAGFAPRDEGKPGPTPGDSWVRAVLGDVASGRELAGRGDAEDLDIAAECDASSVVPQLVSGGFVPHHGEVAIRPATVHDAEQVASMWLRSWDCALPSVRRAHSDDEVRGWVRAVLLPAGRTWVAESAGERGDRGAVVGMLTTHDGWVDQLFIDPAAQGRGIGSALLALARVRAEARDPSGLQLWTFQVNARARRFYERHGFVAVEFTDGQGNEEREPDVRYARPAAPP